MGRMLDRLLLAGTLTPAALQRTTVIDLKSRGLPWMRDDGGRAQAGFRGDAGDCVCRAAAIAMQRPYREVYDELNAFCRKTEARWRRKERSSARNGVFANTFRLYMVSQGWEWLPTMGIGTGTTVHLAQGELPGGRLIARVSHHYTAVIDGIVHDTYDPCYGGDRCVYGYFRKGTD